MGEIKKIAACKVKPFELIDRDESKGDSSNDEKTDMMMEDGLNADAEKDSIGAKYLKMEHRECFGESSVFVVELPVSEHGRPEVITAKEREIQNLEDYETFEEVLDDGQETIGS